MISHFTNLNSDQSLLGQLDSDLGIFESEL